MKEYAKITQELIDELVAVVGEQYVITDPEKLDRYKTDEEYDPARFRVPDLVVAPASTEEVAAIVKLANKYNVPVTVRSGGTSLADGAIAVCGGMILLMERLNKIVELDTDAMYVTAQAGVRTIDVQRAANEKGFLYAGDPCSAESCLIGANLATNAGGNKAVRYGVTRNQVYGFEMVTPTGEIVKLGSRLKKSSTGYCMEQLVIGSEGTLGIITEVTLKLVPLAPHRFDLLAVFTSDMDAISLVPAVLKAGINPTSIEYMDNSFVKDTARYIEFTGAPHMEDGVYMIVTVETYTEDELDMKMELLNDICEQCGAVDVLEADDRIWHMRRSCQECLSMVSKVSLTDDVVVPVDKIVETLGKVLEISKKHNFPIPAKVLAHVGDGNLHICICKATMTDEEWKEKVHAFHEEVYNFAYSIGGRLAGEHGIGAKKIDYLEEFTPSVEYDLMCKIKRAWDPNLILNPGKVIKA